MLQQFTWTDFLLAAMPLLTAWYAWLFLVYGKGRNGSGGISSRQVSFSGLTGGAAASGYPVPGSGVLPGFGDSGYDDLMGKPRMPEGISRVAVSDVVFAGVEVDQCDDGAEAEVGLVMDVLAEMKDLFGILAKEGGTKQDFFKLIEALKEAYPGIGSHPGIAVINAYVVDHAPFLISVQELESLWD